MQNAASRSGHLQVGAGLATEAEFPQAALGLSHFVIPPSVLSPRSERSDPRVLSDSLVDERKSSGERTLPCGEPSDSTQHNTATD